MALGQNPPSAAFSISFTHELKSAEYGFAFPSGRFDSSECNTKSVKRAFSPTEIHILLSRLINDAHNVRWARRVDMVEGIVTNLPMTQTLRQKIMSSR